MTIIITLLKLFAIGFGISLGFFVAIGVCDALSLAKKYRQDGYNMAVNDILNGHVIRAGVNFNEYVHVKNIEVDWKGEKDET